MNYRDQEKFLHGSRIWGAVVCLAFLATAVATRLAAGGRWRPGETIVFVAAASAHRQAAFAAAEFLMDYLKTRAPFWKKVERADGTHWIAARQTDDAAAARWKKPREAAE